MSNESAGTHLPQPSGGGFRFRSCETSPLGSPVAVRLCRRHAVSMDSLTRCPRRGNPLPLSSSASRQALSPLHSHQTRQRARLSCCLSLEFPCRFRLDPSRCHRLFGRQRLRLAQTRRRTSLKSTLLSTYFSQQLA